MAGRAGFWNRTARKYAASPIADETAYEHKLALTRRYLRPDMQVLEFGCGTGGTACRHAPHVASYRATDISPAMLAIARDRMGAPIPGLSFEEDDIERTVLAPESVDAVLGLSILHLVADPAAVIAKAHAALKPGGIFVTSTACLGRALPLRILIALVAPTGLLPRISFFTEDRLREMMREAGFQIVEDWQPGKGKALFLIVRKADN